MGQVCDRSVAGAGVVLWGKDRCDLGYSVLYLYIESVVRKSDDGRESEENPRAPRGDVYSPGPFGITAWKRSIFAHMKNSKKKPHRYTVLLVPEDSRNVKQFRISTDFLVIVLVLLLMAVIAAASFILYSASQIADERKQIIALNAQLENVTSANITLEADNERLQSELMRATTSLEAKDYVAQQVDSAAAMSFIPSGLPVSGSISTPSEFDASRGTISFRVGHSSRIVSTGDGQVSKVISDPEYGYLVEIDHGNDYVSVYRYSSEPLVSEGNNVLRGTAIFSCSEDTPEFVYEIRFQEKAIDPNTILKIDG